MARLWEDFSLAFGKIRNVVRQRLDKIAHQAADLETEIATLTRAGQALEAEITALDREAREIEAEAEAKLQELGGKEAAIETIEGEQAALTAEIEGLRQKLAALPKLSEIEAQRAEIETRLAGFASPFGSIPIGLKEAVLAYPLILAAGFLVCALLLSRLLALRRAFRSSLAMEQSLSEADVDRRVATLTSLWFDPGRQLWANPALLLALIIPFAFFLGTGWLILNDWLLQLGDTASAVNLRAFYAGLYALGLVVFAAGLARVWIAWKQD